MTSQRVIRYDIRVLTVICQDESIKNERLRRSFQVDGEACRLLPSIITMKLLNKATMLAKRRTAGRPQQDVKLERLKLPVMKIKMSDYERYHHDKDMLKKSAAMWIENPLDLDATTDLESLRKILAKDHNMDTCCFLDCEYCQNTFIRDSRITGL